MPTYTYECADCGNQFEVVDKMSEHTVTKACECGGIAESIIVGKRAGHTWEGFFHKTARRQFNTRKEFESYCRKNDFYRPTSSEIKDLREKDQFE